MQLQMWPALTEESSATACAEDDAVRAAADPVAHAWALLQGVLDPEVPALSVCDLGIVRDVRLQEDGALEVVLTPTYSGCPATEVIEADVLAALRAAGLRARAVTRLEPAWTSDWISAEGRSKLQAYGIAAPGKCRTSSDQQPIRWVHRRQTVDPVTCPHCGSAHTERLSAFGSTACKALWRCLDCREPFEQFKPI